MKNEKKINNIHLSAKYVYSFDHNVLKYGSRWIIQESNDMLVSSLLASTPVLYNIIHNIISEFGMQINNCSMAGLAMDIQLNNVNSQKCSE